MEAIGAEGEKSMCAVPVPVPTVGMYWLTVLLGLLNAILLSMRDYSSAYLPRIFLYLPRIFLSLITLLMSLS